MTSKVKTPKSKTWSGGRLKDISADISRIFDGQPVADAKNDLLIVIKPDDLNKGKSKNFGQCVFAQACKRLFNSSKVFIMSSIAYISLPDAKGDYKVERFIISSLGKKLIADFDRGVLPAPGTAFVFSAPSKGKSLDYLRKVSQKHYRAKREAKMRGEISNVTNKSKEINQPLEGIIDIRNGSGLIQMRRKLEES